LDFVVGANGEWVQSGR